MRKAILVLAVSLLTLTNTACEPGLAWGDPQAVVVVAPQELWDQVEDSVFTVLSPTIWTVREDYTFRVAYRAPDDTNNWWRFKELVLIGSQEDAWLAEALEALPREITPQAPNIYDAEDVWAMGQKVTIILIDPQQDVEEQVLSRVAAVHTRLFDRFVMGAAGRMFQSGVDSALVDTLIHTAGFSLLLPQVYTWGLEDSVYVFRNDNPDPAELIRQFTVSWRTPAPAEISIEALFDWRKEISENYWIWPQVVARESLRTKSLEGTNLPIVETRGTWKNPPDGVWPAAGALITWSVSCPHQNRLYLVDSWLYAPSEDKWEYILQMETILHSFKCGTQGV